MQGTIDPHPLRRIREAREPNLQKSSLRCAAVFRTALLVGSGLAVCCATSRAASSEFLDPDVDFRKRKSSLYFSPQNLPPEFLLPNLPTMSQILRTRRPATARRPIEEASTLQFRKPEERGIEEAAAWPTKAAEKRPKSAGQDGPRVVTWKDTAAPQTPAKTAAVATDTSMPSEAESSGQKKRSPIEAFDLARLSLSTVFDAQPIARRYGTSFGANYALTDNFQIGLLVPTSFSGIGALGGLNSNGAGIRGTYINVLDEAGTFVGLSADLGVGTNAAAGFALGRTFGLAVTPFVGGRRDANEFFLSTTLGSIVAATARWTRKLNDRFSVGLEYNANFGPFGTLLPFEQQSHILYGLTEYKLDDAKIAVGLGYGLTRVSRGPAVRLAFSRSFQSSSPAQSESIPPISTIRH